MLVAGLLASPSVPAETVSLSLNADPTSRWYEDFSNVYAELGKPFSGSQVADGFFLITTGAQIGTGVHLAGGVGIGGVLEPPGARPVIVEDGAFIGSRCILTEGVRIGAGAVLGRRIAGRFRAVRDRQPVDRRANSESSVPAT